MEWGKNLFLLHLTEARLLAPILCDATPHFRPLHPFLSDNLK